jgi:hypothetical protein
LEVPFGLGSVSERAFDPDTKLTMLTLLPSASGDAPARPRVAPGLVSALEGKLAPDARVVCAALSGKFFGRFLILGS